MSNICVIILMCYVHNQWYDISCAILYLVIRLGYWSTLYIAKFIVVPVTTHKRKRLRTPAVFSRVHYDLCQHEYHNQQNYTHLLLTPSVQTKTTSSATFNKYTVNPPASSVVFFLSNLAIWVSTPQQCVTDTIRETMSSITRVCV